MKKNPQQQHIQAILITLGCTLVGIVMFGYMWNATEQIDVAVSPKMDDFAQCLASKKITMYGAAWCTHCKKEKAAFGSSFSYVPYVECPDNAQLCLDKGITGYPTWITAEGVAYVGEQGLPKLAEITGCSL